MTQFDPYKDYSLWEKRVLSSAMEHAVIALKSGNAEKTPGVYLYWLVELSNHLSKHYQRSEEKEK